MAYEFIEDKPHTEWTTAEANAVAKAFVRLELECRTLRKELAERTERMPTLTSTAGALSGGVLSDQAIVELAVQAGFGIINANESPPTYDMRRTIKLVRLALVENHRRAGEASPTTQDLAAFCGGHEIASGQICFPTWAALGRYGSIIANLASGTIALAPENTETGPERSIEPDA
jgi:hypothetical protein